MKIAEAVKERIEEIIYEKKISKYSLYNGTGISEGTINGILYVKNKGINLTTLVEIIRVLGITVQEFFNSPLFDVDKLD